MEKFEVKLGEAVLRVLHELLPRYPATRITFSELPVIDSDPIVVHALLFHAIENAFRYSAFSPQPAVEISLDTSGTLQVIDNGPGEPRQVRISFEE